MADGSGGDGQAPPQAKTWFQNFASVFNLTHELPVGWDPQKLEFPEKLKLGIGQKIHLLWLLLLAYGGFAAALQAGSVYVDKQDGKNDWWYWWTLFFAFLPCAFYTVTQFFTHYSEPGRPVQGRELKAGEKPPRLGRREISWYGYIFLTILNVFQLRMLYEFLLSLWWGFPTGALLDWKLVEVIFRDVPQVFLQSYIMFRQWDSTTPFSFTPVLVCTGFALANIIFAPHSSPCFEDNRSLMVIMDEQDEREIARRIRRQEKLEAQQNADVSLASFQKE